MPTAVAKAQAKNSKIGIACIICKASLHIVNNITMSLQKNLDALESERERYQPKPNDLKPSNTFTLEKHGAQESPGQKPHPEASLPSTITLAVYFVPIHRERNTLLTNNLQSPRIKVVIITSGSKATQPSLAFRFSFEDTNLLRSKRVLSELPVHSCRRVAPCL